MLFGGLLNLLKSYLCLFFLISSLSVFICFSRTNRYALTLHWTPFTTTIFHPLLAGHVGVPSVYFQVIMNIFDIFSLFLSQCLYLSFFLSFLMLELTFLSYLSTLIFISQWSHRFISSNWSTFCKREFCFKESFTC